MRAVEFAKTRRAEMIQFIIRQYKMEREVADSVYDALMDTLNPTLSAHGSRSAARTEPHRRAKQDKVYREACGCGGFYADQASDSGVVEVT